MPEHTKSLEEKEEAVVPAGVVSKFFQLSLASILANLMVPLAGLFDSAFLGHLQDINQLGGVILATIFFDYLYRTLKVIRNSTNAITAQAIGQGDQKGVLTAALQSSLIALAIAFTILILQYPISKLGFLVIGGSSTIESAGLQYFDARIWGAPAVLLNFIFIGWFFGKGKGWFVLLLSLIGNGSNVLFDYLMIMQWNWGSVGAGVATALSQYLALAAALVGFSLSIQWQVLPSAMKEILAWDSLRQSLALKGNILVRYIAMVSMYAVFTDLSAVLGTTTLTANGLILQIVLLGVFTINGIGLTCQSFIGTYKGKGDFETLKFILNLSISSSLVVALPFALLPICFPQTIFALLTNHAEVQSVMQAYTLWLLPLCLLTAIALMLEGYFTGLKQGAVLRNSALLSLGLGCLPVASAAYFFKSPHLLWLSLIAYWMLSVLILGAQVVESQRNLSLEASSASLVKSTGV